MFVAVLEINEVSVASGVVSSEKDSIIASTLQDLKKMIRDVQFSVPKRLIETAGLVEAYVAGYKIYDLADTKVVLEVKGLPKDM